MGVTWSFVNFTGHWAHVCTSRHSAATGATKAWKHLGKTLSSLKPKTQIFNIIWFFRNIESGNTDGKNHDVDLHVMWFVFCRRNSSPSAKGNMRLATHESTEELNKERLILFCLGILTLLWFARFKDKRTLDKISLLFVIVNRSYI